MINNRCFLGWVLILGMMTAGCQDTERERQAPVEPPNPDFKSANTNCRAPCEVKFTSLVDNAESYSWAFGDGDTSTSANPAHVYERRGNYSVSLKVSNESGTEVIVKRISIDSGFNVAAIQEVTINNFPTTDTNKTGWDPNSPPDLYVELQQDPDSLIVSNTTVYPNVVDSLDLPRTWSFSSPLPTIADFASRYTFRLIDEDSGSPDRTVISYALPENSLKAAPDPYPEQVPIRNEADEQIGTIALEWR